MDLPQRACMAGVIFSLLDSADGVLPLSSCCDTH